MRPGDRRWRRRRRRVGVALAVLGLVMVVAESRTLRGDEPRGLGRFFRLGGTPPKPAAPARAAPRGPPAAPAFPPPLLTPGSAPAATAQASANATAGRIVPQPRVNRPVTESDPLLTRVALGRADDGKAFGMFLQVYADGTVIDTEGVHRVGAETLRPLVQAIQATDANRSRGHCGGPATDFIEGVYLVIYDRSLGRLRANAFSYSGNPQGCDASIRQLQAAIDAIQLKVSPPPSPATGSPADAPEPPYSPAPPSAAPPIPLTTTP